MDEISNELQVAGFRVQRMSLHRNVQSIKDEVADCAKRAVPLIGIGGGDGTQRLGAELLAGKESIMTVLPMGTGNALASDLGIPQDPKTMAECLAGSIVQSIDVGWCNGMAFVNVATLGLSANIAKNIPKSFKKKIGKWVYLPAVLKSIRSITPFQIDIETEGDKFSGPVIQFVAGAGRTHAGSLMVTRRASNSDGRLSLYAVGEDGRRGLVRLGLGLITGSHTHLEEVWSCQAATAIVTTAPQKELILDGEPSGKSPLELRIDQNSLKVLAPVIEDNK